MYLQLWSVLLLITFCIVINGSKNSEQFRERLSFYHMQNGTKANPDDWKFFVPVVQGEIVICTGSLISSQWVLTAARCFQSNYKVFKENFKLELGVGINVKRLTTKFLPDIIKNTLPIHGDLKNEKLYYSTIPQENIILGTKRIHNSYLQKYKGLDVFRHDIALIKLNEPVTLTKEIKLVEFPKKRESNFTTCKTIGWAPENTPYSKHVLYEIALTIMSPDDIKKKIEIKDSDLKDVLEYNKLITESNNQARLGGDDMGAPLMCEDGLQGIASLTIQVKKHGAQLYYPAFTRVDRYISWIHEIQNIG